MPPEEQREVARRSLRKTQAGVRDEKTISRLTSETRSALGREATKTAAHLGSDGRLTMAKAQVIRADSQRRRWARG